jgi:hypothetical protein
VAQQARNLAWKLQDGGPKVKFLLRDRDTKFSAAFDEVFKSEGLRVIHLPYRRPVANSIAERFVGTRPEVLVENASKAVAALHPPGPERDHVGWLAGPALLQPLVRSGVVVVLDSA